jgi:hypothetical protein
MVDMRARILILTAVLAVTGCSSDQGSPSPGTTAGGPPPATASGGAGQASDELPDPCTLLTKAEVDAATGGSFAEGAINATVTQDHLKACDWQSSGVATVQALVTTVDAFDSSRQVAADTYGSADDVSIPGAKRAYVVKGGFLIGMDIGTVFLQVSYIATGANVAAATKDLAGKAAARMS